MAKDNFKRNRRSLRPGSSSEFSGKGIKSVNRRIVRKKLKENLRRNEE